MAEQDLPSGDPTPVRAQASRPKSHPVLRLGEWTIVVTPKWQIGLSLAGLAALATLGLSFLSEFDQTRNIVSLWYSRVWLSLLCVVIFLAFWLVSGQLLVKHRWAISLSAIAAVLAFVMIDKWAPKPTPAPVAPEDPIVHIEPERDILWSTHPGQKLEIFTVQFHNTGVPVDVTEIDLKYFIAQKSSGVIIKRLPDVTEQHKGLLQRDGSFPVSIDFNPYTDEISEISSNFKDGPSLAGVYIVASYRRHSDGKDFELSKAYGLFWVPYGDAKKPKGVAIFTVGTNMDEPAPPPMRTSKLTLAEVAPFLPLPERWVAITKYIGVGPDGKIITSLDKPLVPSMPVIYPWLSAVGIVKADNGFVSTVGLQIRIREFPESSQEAKGVASLASLYKFHLNADVLVSAMPKDHSFRSCPVETVARDEWNYDDGSQRIVYLDLFGDATLITFRATSRDAAWGGTIVLRRYRNAKGSAKEWAFSQDVALAGVLTEDGKERHVQASEFIRYSPKLKVTKGNHMPVDLNSDLSQYTPAAPLAACPVPRIVQAP